jgi:hypothetical protein
LAFLQSHVLFRIHDLHVETRQWSTATDNLRGCVDLGNLGCHAGLPKRKGTLVHGNDVPAAQRNRQSILGQPKGGIKALRFQAVGLKCLQEPREGIWLYRFCGTHQHAKRTEITPLQTLLRKSSSA